MRRITYKESGVSIKRGEEFSQFVHKLFPQKTHLLSFASLFPFKKYLKEFKEPVLVSSCDGVGTKLKIAQFLNIHHTVGIDLVAMNVNDIVCLGAEPLFFLDYIACGKLKKKTLGLVMEGIKKGLEEADCVLLGGETAEMPGMYGEDEYDLAGFCVGIAEKKRIVDGRRIKRGDIVLGIASSGLHSNGFSLVRKVLDKKEIKKYKEELLKPTRIYAKPILKLFKIFPSDIHGVAHITGGAFYNKATKIIPQGLKMIIRKKWPVPEIFKIIQEKGVEEKEMYSVFNMGIGMILVVNKKNASKISSYLNKFWPTYIIGEIEKGEKRIELINEFRHH